MSQFTTWREGVEAYSNYSTLHHAESTQALVASTLRRLGEHVGDRPPHLVTREDAESFQVRAVERGIAPASVNRELRTLRAFFGWHVDHGSCDSNPFARIRPLKVIRRRRHIAPPAEVERLIGALEEHGENWYADLVRVIVNTGMRLGEALHLEAEDVDPERRLLTIRCRAAYVTKDREERVIPLNDVALEVLNRRRLVSGGGPLWVVGGPGRRGKLARKDSVSHGMTRLARRLGLPGMTWYILRHVFATVVASQVQPYVLCAILGHSSVQTTEKWYLERSHLALVAPPVVG